MAAKLIRAKETALEIDPEYYKSPLGQLARGVPRLDAASRRAAVDAYLGNGYFPTWCLDVVRRQLARAARDPRYGFGETILTVWPPPANFTGINAVTRVLHVDDDGDGRGDRTVTVPMPIFHVLESAFGPRRSLLGVARANVGGHVVSGFASRDQRGSCGCYFTPTTHRIPSRGRRPRFRHQRRPCGHGRRPGRSALTESRFDRDHNSPFRCARCSSSTRLRRAPVPPLHIWPPVHQ